MKDRKLQCQPQFGQIWLDQLVKKSHPIVKVADLIDWDAIERDLGQHFPSDIGRPCIPFRLAAGLLLLKYAYGHSDDGVLEVWSRDPYYQYFCGGEVYVQDPPISRPTLSNWRKRLGEEGVAKLLSATIELAKRVGMIDDESCRKLTCDTTPMEKNIAYPRDGRLYEDGRRRLTRLAGRMGIPVKDEYAREARRLNIEACHLGRRRDRGPFNRTLAEMRRNVRSLIAEMRGKLDTVVDQAGRSLIEKEIEIVERVLAQRRRDKNKILSLYEPEVACMFSGKPGKRYGYGTKTHVAATHKMSIVTAIRALHGAPYDGHSLEEVLRDSERNTGVAPKKVFADRGYRGHNARSAQVCITGMQGGLSEEDIADLKMRPRIEGSIGYMKQSGHLALCRLKGRLGDAVNAGLCGCGYNIRKVMLWTQREPALQN